MSASPCGIFRQSRVFAFVAVLSLVLGIGANTAIFAVFDTLYLRKVPVPQPDELVSLRWRAFAVRRCGFSGLSSRAQSRFDRSGVRPALRVTSRSSEYLIYYQRTGTAMLRGGAA
jgi:hypothetical protein